MILGMQIRLVVSLLNFMNNESSAKVKFYIPETLYFFEKNIQYLLECFYINLTCVLLKTLLYYQWKNMIKLV